MHFIHCPEFLITNNYVAYRKKDKVHKPAGSECYTPTSEPFGLYLCSLTFKYRTKD
jgi:hypothetical protein